jgi:hypothetical protein
MLQSMLFWLFLDGVLMNYLPGMAMNSDSPRIKVMSHQHSAEKTILRCDLEIFQLAVAYIHSTNSLSTNKAYWYHQIRNMSSWGHTVWHGFTKYYRSVPHLCWMAGESSIETTSQRIL